MQREFRLSYDWDNAKRCYLKHQGHFICYTDTDHARLNEVRCISTIDLKPRHVAVITADIKGHTLTEKTACFISHALEDPMISFIDGIINLDQRNKTNIIVANHSNKHFKLRKGTPIGTLNTPPSPDDTKIPINSVSTDKARSETVPTEPFTPPTHTLDKATQQRLDQLLQDYKDQFAKDETTIGTTHLTQMAIDTGDSEPQSQKPYPVAMKHHDWVKSEIDKLLEAKVIRPSHSSWSAPIIVVPKGDGGRRLVIDYRALNNVTRKFVWPMPKVEDIFSQLDGAIYFSTLDLRAGYHHIKLTEDSIPKTAFTSPFGKYEYVKVPFGLAQAPAYFQELMTGILKEMPFAMAYLDDIIIFSKTAEEHLQHIETVFKKLRSAKLSMKLSKCHFFATEIQYLGHILGEKGIRPVPAKTAAIDRMTPPKTPKQVRAFLGLIGYYRKFIKNFAQLAKPLTLLTRADVKFEWEDKHRNAFLVLKKAIAEAPILRYPDANKRYIVYTDASNDACGAQLNQEHDDGEFPVAFLSHTFTETQRKWSTTEQEAYGIFYAIKKWNYYLQGAEIILRNDHKPLAKFLHTRINNSKVDRWGLELNEYNITFEWISGARNKAADCLSRLVDVPDNPSTEQPVKTVQFCIRSIQQATDHTTSEEAHDTHAPSVKEPQTTTHEPPINTPSGTRTDLRELQHTDPFCKRITKRLLNNTAPTHEREAFFLHNGLLYKKVSDTTKDFYALVTPKSWRYTILVETHDKMGHQGNNRSYALIKRQYYWKGMAKDIKTYIQACPACKRDKERVQSYPLQMTEIPDRPFDRIAMDLVTDFNESGNGNKHILTIIDHLTGWPEAFPIPDKSANTITNTFIREYIPRHMCPRFILSDNGTEFKNQLFDEVAKELGIERSFSAPYHPQSNGKLETFHKFLKPALKKMCENDPDNWDRYIQIVLGSYRCAPNLVTGETPFFLVYGRDPNQPIHQLLQPMTRFMGDPESGKLCLEKHRLALALAKKYLDDHRFLTSEKTTDRQEPTFKIGDRVFYKNKTPGKWDLKWRAGYRIVRIEREGRYLHIENQATGKTRSCNVKDVTLEPPVELWKGNPEFGRAGKFINHPENLPTFKEDSNDEH